MLTKSANGIAVCRGKQESFLVLPHTLTLNSSLLQELTTIKRLTLHSLFSMTASSICNYLNFNELN